MPKMQVTGLDELIAKVEKMRQRPEGLVKRALYKGAGVMADALKSAVNAIPTDEAYGTKRHPKAGLLPEEKASLVSGLGISRMESNGGTVSVVIGFKGMNANGKKNSTVMRRVESGTSIMRKTPTIRPTANRTKAAAFAAMQEQFSRDMDEVFND